MNARIRALPTPAGLNQGLAEATPLMNDIQHQLAQVVPPPQHESQYTSMLGTMRQDYTDVPQFIAAIQARDTGVEQTLGREIQALNDKFHSEAADLGLTECNLEVAPQG